MTAPQLMAALTLGWLGYRLFSPRKRKKSAEATSADLPTLDCGLYPWKPLEIDVELEMAIVRGERNLERLALQAAREVYPQTPEGTPQPWPPAEDDARAQCILDRIRIRGNLRLAELADDDADGHGLDPEPLDEPVAP